MLSYKRFRCSCNCSSVLYKDNRELFPIWSYSPSLKFKHSNKLPTATTIRRARDLPTLKIGVSKSFACFKSCTSSGFFCYQLLQFFCCCCCSLIELRKIDYVSHLWVHSIRGSFGMHLQKPKLEKKKKIMTSLMIMYVVGFASYQDFSILVHDLLRGYARIEFFVVIFSQTWGWRRIK